jgi:Tol biopolymer transport system component
VGGAFAPAQPLVEANSGSEDNGAFLTADRLELFFFSGRPGGAGGRDIWVLRRAAPTAPWDAPRVVTELNSSNDDYMPSLTGDGLTIFFASNRIGRSDDIWTASRASRTAPFSVPATVAELSSLPTPATSPFIARDGLTLLFADERAGGQGARDLWTTTRASPTAPFANPTNLGALFNSAAIDDDPSLSFDGRELFFASDRVAADSRIYRAIRCP